MIEKINKLRNPLFKYKLNLLVSCLICVIIVLCGAIFSIINVNELWMIIIPIVLLLTLISFVLFNRSFKKENYTYSDNELIKIRRIKFIFSDVLFVCILCYIVIFAYLYESLYSLSDFILYYNYINYDEFLKAQIIAFLSILTVIYLCFRIALINKNNRAKNIYRAVIVIMNIALIISIATFFSTAIVVLKRYKCQTNLPYECIYHLPKRYYFFNIFLYYNSYSLLDCEFYLFRIVSIFLYIVSIFFYLYSIIGKTYIYSFFSLLIGILASGLITVDYYIKEFEVELWVSFIGVFCFIITLLSIIYLLIFKNKVYEE